LPEGYRLERDPEVLPLVAGGGLLVAAFSARGATEGAVREADWEAHGAERRPRRKPEFSGSLFHALERVMNLGEIVQKYGFHGRLVSLAISVSRIPKLFLIEFITRPRVYGGRSQPLVVPSPSLLSVISASPIHCS
jgi:hypothetical protein